MDQKDAMSTQSGRNGFNGEHSQIDDEKLDPSEAQFEPTARAELPPDPDAHLTKEEKIAAVSFALSLYPALNCI